MPWWGWVILAIMVGGLYIYGMCSSSGTADDQSDEYLNKIHHGRPTDDGLED
jgi:hypothetical protein